MNICMFTNTYRPHVGGVARSVSLFEEDLRRLGHRVLIVAPTFSRARQELDEPHVLRVPAIQNFNGSDFSVRIPLPFIIDEKIDEFAPDIIHSHHPFLLGDSAIRAANRRKLPIVFTHHTRYEQYTHYVSSNSPTMKRFVINLSTTYANGCTRVVAPSKSIADLIRQRGVTTPVTEIPTGVDFSAFQGGSGQVFRKRHHIPETADVIGHVGRLAPEKNLAYLTDAITGYMKTNADAHFLVVGDGPGIDDIKHRFSKAGLSDRLVLAGKKSGQDLFDAYAAMDLFVFSSLSETQGLVVAEAMAAKTPVVALDATGVREVVKDDENGRLLPADASVNAFAEAVAAFFNSRDLARRWQNNAHETARQFDRLKCAQMMADLYAKTMQQKPKPPKEYDDIMQSWEEVLRALRTEWDLLSGKVNAVAQTFQASEKKRPPGN
ncbi:MAG: glycosyltransferase [Thermodesulfobacteriota bacterium]